MGAWLALALCLVLPARIGAQDAQVLTAAFARNFQRAEKLDTRVAIVRDAADAGVAGMGPFYAGVLAFVASRASEIGGDSRLQEMARVALAKITEERYAAGGAEAWKLFKAADDAATRTAALAAIEAAAAADSVLVAEMNAYLTALNELQRAAGHPDQQLVLALVRTIGSIGAPDSFGALFGARSAGHSREVAAAAEAALFALRADVRELLTALIRSGSAAERRDAFALVASMPSMRGQPAAELAEETLRAALAMTGPGEQDRAAARELRAAAMEVLAAARWSRATAAAAEHFSTATVEYDRRQVTADYVAAAAAGLAAMGTHEAAQRLIVYLDLLNSYRELGRPYDEKIVLAVIAGLARLGDKASFGSLSYARYLDYSARVKQAAADAISSLKW